MMTFALNGHASKGVQILQKYGLTRYESLAYFSLLLLGETGAGNLAIKSGVPQSKIYWTLIDLQKKGLVAITQEFPKKVVALPLEIYLSRYITAKQEEIEELLACRKELRKVLCELQPIVLMHGDKIQIFEPSHKGGLPPAFDK